MRPCAGLVIVCASDSVGVGLEAQQAFSDVTAGPATPSECRATRTRRSWQYEVDEGHASTRLCHLAGGEDSPRSLDRRESTCAMRRTRRRSTSCRRPPQRTRCLPTTKRCSATMSCSVAPDAIAGAATSGRTRCSGTRCCMAPTQNQSYLAARRGQHLVSVYVIRRGNKRVYVHVGVLTPEGEVAVASNDLVLRRLSGNGHAVVEGVRPAQPMGHFAPDAQNAVHPARRNTCRRWGLSRSCTWFATSTDRVTVASADRGVGPLRASGVATILATDDGPDAGAVCCRPVATARPGKPFAIGARAAASAGS